MAHRLAERTIAVLGFGNQGEAHALNLREAGSEVVVGARAGGAAEARARRLGFPTLDLAGAARRAAVVAVLLPDEVVPAVWPDLAAALAPGTALVFAHGYNLLYASARDAGGRRRRAGLADRARPGAARARERGETLPGYLAVHVDASGAAWELAAGYAGPAGLRPGLAHDRARGDRGGPLRRAGRAVRRAERAADRGLRDAGRGRLRARDGLPRVHPPASRTWPSCCTSAASPDRGGPSAPRRSTATSPAARASWTTRTRGELKRMLEEIRDGRVRPRLGGRGRRRRGLAEGEGRRGGAAPPRGGPPPGPRGHGGRPLRPGGIAQRLAQKPIDRLSIGLLACGPEAAIGPPRHGPGWR